MGKYWQLQTCAKWFKVCKLLPKKILLQSLQSKFTFAKTLCLKKKKKRKLCGGLCRHGCCMWWKNTWKPRQKINGSKWAHANRSCRFVNELVLGSSSELANGHPTKWYYQVVGSNGFRVLTNLDGTFSMMGATAAACTWKITSSKFIVTIDKPSNKKMTKGSFIWMVVPMVVNYILSFFRA